MTEEEIGEEMTRANERSKAKLLPPPGKEQILTNFVQICECDRNVNKAAEVAQSFQFIAEMDQDYLTVGNHVDKMTQEKIQNNKYVDFSKLIPKDKLLMEEDGISGQEWENILVASI